MRRAILIIIHLIVIWTISPENCYSQNADSKKGYISSMVIQGSKLTKKSITLSENEKKEIDKFLKISDTPEKMTFINIKSKKGELLRSITFMERYLSEFNQYHTIGVAINSNGTVHDASVIGAADPYSLMLATKSFTGQFPGKSLKNSTFQKDINGITGATVSAKVFTDAIRISLKVFEKHLM